MGVITLIEACMIPCLSKPSDESLDHAEFNIYKQSIVEQLNNLKSFLSRDDFNFVFIDVSKIEVYSSLIILLEELQIEGEWHADNMGIFVSFLKNWILNIEGCDVLSCLGNNYGENETLYLACVRKIHSKLSREKWKHYPASVYCYHRITKYLNNYDVGNCPLPLVLPAAFILMDDYQPKNKVIGVDCCTAIFKYNTKNNADTFGFEMVVYECLMKHLRYIDNNVLAHTVDCLEVLLPSLKSKNDCHSSKWTKIDDITNILIEDLYLESDPKKRKLLLKSLKATFNMSGVSAVRWSKKFVDLSIDLFEGFLDKTHREMLLVDSINCFREWLKYGWTLFSYSRNTRVFQIITKVLYVQTLEDSNDSSGHTKELVNFISTLCQLCQEDDKIRILEDIENGIKSFHNNYEFISCVKSIQEVISGIPRTCVN